MRPPNQLKTDIKTCIESTRYIQDHLDELLSLLQSTRYGLKLIPKIVIHGPSGSGKRTIAELAAQKMNMTFIDENLSDLIDDDEFVLGTEKLIVASIKKAAEKVPCIMYMTNYDFLSYYEDEDLAFIEQGIAEALEEIENETTQPFIFIAATKDLDRINKSVLSHIFHYCLPVRPPNQRRAIEILKALLESQSFASLRGCDPEEVLFSIKDKTHDDNYHLFSLIGALNTLSLNLYKKIDVPQETRAKTEWLDIGGLNEIKQEIIDMIQLPLEYPQLKKNGLMRTGILLHGPPGTGKTLLAKAIATECKLKFIGVKGPELLSMYIGDSESNIRRVFQRARDESPCVVFFDEFDSLAPSRGHAGDSGSAMDRVVSQILVEMDGIGKKGDVFIIAATNRLDLIDPSLLRPGRFDKVLEVPKPRGRENRLQVLQASTRKMQLAQDVNLDKLESMLRDDMSGADFQDLCSRAMHKTLDRCIELIKSTGVSDDEVEIVTTMDDFVQCI